VLGELSPHLQVDRGWQQAMEDTTEATVLDGQGSHAVLASLFRLQSLGWDIPEVFQEALDEFVLRRVMADAEAAKMAQIAEGDIE
jgi:hypothetical protein